ncbi:hypothetical protein CBR_g38435 [Chara braunii]|uniref:Uncharacterized protein n=1 Tax=Chara braunii TaxID=69332 RepID=A0A388JNL0_CHABU|nr:hypothetical protein CBR_g38435 [Chara braunii]|eukprot:GBG59409.1 hypothetical protein CBR_g38435 [Chara braunii]
MEGDLGRLEGGRGPDVEGDDGEGDSGRPAPAHSVGSCQSSQGPIGGDAAGPVEGDYPVRMGSMSLMLVLRDPSPVANEVPSPSVEGGRGVVEKGEGGTTHDHHDPRGDLEEGQITPVLLNPDALQRVLVEDPTRRGSAKSHGVGARSPPLYTPLNPLYYGSPASLEREQQQSESVRAATSGLRGAAPAIYTSREDGVVSPQGERHHSSINELESLIAMEEAQLRELHDELDKECVRMAATRTSEADTREESIKLVRSDTTAGKYDRGSWRILSMRGISIAVRIPMQMKAMMGSLDPSPKGGCGRSRRPGCSWNGEVPPRPPVLSQCWKQCAPLAIGLLMVLIAVSAAESRILNPTEYVVTVAINTLRRQAGVSPLNREIELNCAADRRIDTVSAANATCQRNDTAALAAADDCKLLGDYKGAAELLDCGGQDNPLQMFVGNQTTRTVLLDPTYKDVGIAMRSTDRGTIMLRMGDNGAAAAAERPTVLCTGIMQTRFYSLNGQPANTRREGKMNKGDGVMKRRHEAEVSSSMSYVESVDGVWTLLLC